MGRVVYNCRQRPAQLSLAMENMGSQVTV